MLGAVSQSVNLGKDEPRDLKMKWLVIVGDSVNMEMVLPANPKKY